jgi:hypothetical protein
MNKPLNAKAAKESLPLADFLGVASALPIQFDY